MSDDQFRYAMHYFRYGSEDIEYGDNIRDLVQQGISADDDGEQSTHGFYEAVAGEWVELDVSAITKSVRAKDAARYAARSEGPEKPWMVWIFGPNNVDTLWSRSETEDEAQRVADALPAAMRATVTTDLARPADWSWRTTLTDITRPLPVTTP